MLELPDALILFVFGTILGSFLNALAFRYQSGKTMWGRSACMACNRTLEAIDLVPILSYLFLRARCRRCRTRISPQYPMVELLAGIITVLCYASAPSLALFLVSLAFFQVALFICVYDIRHTIIPDPFVYTLSVLALIYGWLSRGGSASLFALDPYWLLAGPLLALPLFLIWYFSKGRAIGLGDAKLFLAVGWLLGLSAGFAAFVLSFWTGAVVGVLLIVASRGATKRFTMKRELPFGPFVLFATALIYFCHLDFYTFMGLFFPTL